MGLDEIAAVEPTHSPEYPVEAAVENRVADYFRQQGYNEVRQSSDHSEDIPDVIVLGDEVKWGIEVKGESASNKERIYTAIGQIVYEMPYDEIEQDNLRWAIAFPEIIDSRKQYRERINQNVSREILEMLGIYVMFVKESGAVEILEPGDIGAQ